MRPGRWALCMTPEPRAARYKNAPLRKAQANNEPAAAELNYYLRENLLDWQVVWIGKHNL